MPLTQLSQLSQLLPAFLRPKLSDGWLSVSFVQDRIDIAHIRRQPGQKPEVLLLESVVRGENDLEALSGVCKALNLGRYRCSAVLKSGEYQILPVDPPAVPAAEMKEALRWSVKDLIEFPVELAAVEMLAVPDDFGSLLGKVQQIFAVVSSDELLHPKVNMFGAAGYQLEAIDIPELAQRNISALFEKDGQGLAMLTIDENCTLLTFTFHGELYTVRQTEINLMQLLRADDGRRDQLFERIALETQRSLDNFDRLHGHITLSGLMVSPLPGVNGFLDYLRVYLSAPVTEIDLTEVLDITAVPGLNLLDRQAQCLKAIGAALRD